MQTGQEAENSRSDPTLDGLIKKAVGGDRVALESVLMHFHDPLLQHIRGMIGGPMSGKITAEDLLQEVLIEVFRRIGKLEHKGSEAFGAWLKVIARTRWINAAKAQQALKRGGGRQILVGPAVAGDESTAKSVLGLLAGSGPTASVIARRREALEAVGKALEDLTPEKKQVLDLRYGQQLSITEVAKIVGKNESAVKMILSRAIKELRDRVDVLGEFSSGA